MNEINKLLEQKRNDAGLTKKYVSEYLGLSYTTYAAYEYGRSTPSPDAIAKLAELYGITVDELLGIEKAPEYTEPMVTRDQLVDFLLSAGLIKDGEDLSDSDLHFLEALIAAAAEWFSAKNA